MLAKRRINIKLKTIQVMFVLFIGVICFGLSNKAMAAKKVFTSEQIADFFNGRVGQEYPNNKCMKFVADGFQSMGAERSSACCAYKYGSGHIQSNSINDIPIGADVFFGNCAKGPCGICGAAYYGHIGVYVGNGYFVHATGGKVQKTPLSSWQSKYRGWGIHGNVDIKSGNPVQPNPDQIPSINSVTISSIDNGIVNFSFSVNDGTLAKIVIESTLTGETMVKSYTDNLSNIKYTFNRMSMPTGGNQYHIYLYAYSGSVNNYKNEQVHKMTYGSTMQCVTFPDTINNDQLKAITFNSRFYADIYEDVRNAYGYDDKLLYMHWLKDGIKEGRIGCPGYCASFYLKNNGDIANAYGEKNYELAFYHYTTYGYKEGIRESSPVFSASYYLDNNGDIANAYGKENYLQAAIHFNTFSAMNELRNSSIYYDGQYYKDNNGDLGKMTPYELILHYYKYGIGEKRYANLENKVPNI